MSDRLSAFQQEALTHTGMVQVFHSASPFGDDQWYWHIKAGNGEIIAQSEGYTTEADAWRGLRAVIVAGAFLFDHVLAGDDL